MNKHRRSLAATQFSEFNNVRSRCAVSITFQQFADKVKSDNFRLITESYRNMRTLHGKEEEARRIKEKMPCVTPACICIGGHAVTDMRQPSGLLCIDLDHTDGRTEEIKRTAAGLPWTAMAFTSISGCGVKLLIHIDPAEMEQGWAPLYAAVGQCVSHAVGHPYDTQCKTLTQPCYYSWDPDAYYNPDAATFHLSSGAPRPGTADEPRHAGSSGTTTGTAQRIVDFLRGFNRRNAFASGQRNQVCLKLGRMLRCQFFSEEEVEEAIRIYAARFAAGDFTEKDIRNRVIAGYQYIKKIEGEEEPAGWVHLGPGSTMSPPFPGENPGNEEDLSEKNNELFADTPTIPDEVFPLLPPLLQQCTSHAQNTRERDIMLVSSITACSALFPHVSFFYKDRYYAPCLYLAIVAPAGTGKGTMGLASTLLDPTDRHYTEQRKATQQKWEQQLQEWNQEVLCARREKRKPDMKRPAKPAMPYFRISANTSRSRLIESLAASEKTGCIMASTEISSLCTAIAQDYGAFEDILLKAAHHEQVDSSFRIDGEPIVVRSPKLSLMLSGTPEQFGALFRSLESGLYSRFLFYTCGKDKVWKSCAPDSGNTDLERHYQAIGETMKQMHLALLQSPTCVTFSEGQWKEHTATFSRLLRQVDAEGNDTAIGILFRCGLQVMRIAATLTMFRKYEDFRHAKEYRCSDEDFRTAMLVGCTLLQHSLLLSTSLPASLHQVKPMHRFFRLNMLLESLPNQFSYTEFIRKAQDKGIARSTAKRMLKKSQDLLLVDKQGDTYIKVDS